MTAVLGAGAPIDDATIDAIVAQFRRDRSRYERMVDYVRSDLERTLANDLESDVKYQVHWRVKSPESLRIKLAKKRTQPDAPAYALAPAGAGSSAPALLDRIPDLAGIRVLTYTDADLAAVRGVLEAAWDPASPSSLLEWPPEDAPDPKDGPYYRAHHLCVRVHEAADASVEHLQGIKCEVQVTTTADHLLNEVAHDLLYKPSYQDPDTAGQLEALVLDAKRLLTDTKQILTDAVAVAAKAQTRPAGLGGAGGAARTADNALGWLLDALWPGYSDRPGALDRRATRGKRATVPYLVGLAATGLDAQADLHALPGRLRRIIDADGGLAMNAAFDAYTDAARRRGWGRVKSQNPRHLHEQSRLDQAILALLLELEASGILSGPLPRAAGRPTVAMDIVNCFTDRDGAPGSHARDETTRLEAIA